MKKAKQNRLPSSSVYITAIPNKLLWHYKQSLDHSVLISLVWKWNFGKDQPKPGRQTAPYGVKLIWRILVMHNISSRLKLWRHQTRAHSHSQR